MDLVRRIQNEEPHLSIEEVLEKTRYVTLQNVLKDVKTRGYETPIHLVEYLCRRDLTLEDVQTVLGWVAETDIDIRRFIGSNVVAYMYDVMSKDSSPPCCWPRRPGTKSTRNTDPPPSGTSP